MAASSIYDVFLSFSGVDTRNNFTGHLLAALEWNSFNTFRDDVKLARGEEIRPGLLGAIEQSSVSIIVFSKNYTSSDWCLDELVKIMDCKEKLNQIVIPIFYDVKPSEIREQTGFCAFDQTHPNAKNWRSALTKAGNLSGHVLPNVANGCESTLIKDVVRDLKEKLNTVCLSVAPHQVGLEHHVRRVTEFLKLGSNSDDVRIVVIWGIGGIGKTTLAKEMYNRIKRQFEKNCFLGNVGQTSMLPNGLVGLQEKLLNGLHQNQKIISEDQGIEVIRRAFGLRVFLVLDDVDDIRQLKALAIDRDRLRKGSRIIVTTRDRSSVKSLQPYKVYELHGLNEELSLQLFSWHAFKRDHPLKDYENLSKEVLSYAKGLPLVLTTLGSSLFGDTIPQWKNKLEKLKQIPHHDVQGKLRLSYDSLQKEEKDLFLDIACFFVGMDKDLSTIILKGRGFWPESDIKNLSDRCLVRTNEFNQLTMHDLIQDMAKEIVRREFPEEPGERSRLWYREDILNVLKNNTGTKAIQGLVLNLQELEEQPLNAKAFAKMKRLRLLHLNYVQLSGSYKHLSKRLVWLSWKGFSSNYMPSTLIMDNLVAIDLSYSKLKQVWRETKVLCKLKYLNLSHSYFLIKTPDFSGLISLEKLLLNDCRKLVEVHDSIEYLKNLLVLDLENCHNLERIHVSIFMSKSLIDFNMSGCSKLEWPTFFQGSPPESSFLSLQLSSNIRKLYMKDCNISYVPIEIGNLVYLQVLDLRGNKFSNLPASINNLSQLKLLNIDGCSLLESVTALPLNLLELSACSCTSLESISMESKVVKAPKVLRKLKYVNLSPFYLLIETLDFTGLTSFEQLFLNGCKNLVEVHQSIQYLKNLVVLDPKYFKNLEKNPPSIFTMNSLPLKNLISIFTLNSLLLLNMFDSSKSSSSSLQLSRSITELDMPFCNITCVPIEFGSLVSLEYLNLSGNEFFNLPVTITSLPQLKMLIIDHCSLLVSVPAPSLNLLVLSACYCRSLESISMESKVVKAPCLTFYNCPKLVNNNFAYNFRRNLLCFQGMREQGEFNIFLDGSEVPRWCNYRNEGRVLRFQVPQLLGRVIQGFILCVVFHDDDEYNSDDDYDDTTFFSTRYVISNMTKSGYGVFHASRDGLYPLCFEDQIWLSYVPNRCLESKWGNYNCRLDGGDEVQMEIATDFHSWRVLRCGVSLVYEGDYMDTHSCDSDASDYLITNIASDLPPLDENVLGDYMDLHSCDSDASDHSITNIASDLPPLDENVLGDYTDLDSCDSDASDHSITIASDIASLDEDIYIHTCVVLETN